MSKKTCTRQQCAKFSIILVLLQMMLFLLYFASNRVDILSMSTPTIITLEVDNHNNQNRTSFEGINEVVDIDDFVDIDDNKNVAMDRNQESDFDDSNSIHSTLDEYVNFISKFDYLSRSMRQDARYVMINGMSFKVISKESIIENLSNKVIVLFGDSLSHCLTSYILHVLYWCIEDNITQMRKCKTFCDHLDDDKNTSLVLGKCETDMLLHRESLENQIPKFDGYHRKKLQKGTQSKIHLNKHNITIYLYYKWAEDIRGGVDKMISDISEYNRTNYHIMINNLVNLHWTLFPWGNNDRWNYQISYPMIKNMEYYMDKIISNRMNKQQCLIFGPVNPWLYLKEEKFWFRKAVFPLLLQNCDYFMDEMGHNINTSDRNTWIKMSKLTSSPKILQCFDSMDINYSWPNRDEKWKTSLTKTAYMCYKEANRRRNIVKGKIDGGSKEKYQEIMNNFCLLYNQGIGQTIVQHRIKKFVNKRQEHKVYYHDQYTLYSTFDHLAEYVHHAIHFPSLVPLAWNNLLNIIANGC